MAQVDRALLSCAVCLDLLDEPVTVPCGHSFCRRCVLCHWRHQRGHFTCPLCMKVYYRKPGLVKNILLTALVERLKERAPPAAAHARVQNVSCDECTERRRIRGVSVCLEIKSESKAKTHQLGAPSHSKISEEQVQTFSRHHLLQNIQDKQAQLEKLNQEVQNINRSSRETLQRVEDTFSHLSLLLERKRTQVKQQVHLHHKTQLRRVQELQEQLQRDVTELKKSLSELDPLDTEQEEDTTLKAPRPLEVEVEPPRAWSFCEHVTSSVLALSLSLLAPLQLFSAPEPEPTDRVSFLSCACDISMDPSSAHAALFLSEENRQVTLRSPAQSPPDRLHSFTHYRQVLSREALSGRCYWEVEWSGEGGVRVALCYWDMERRGHSDACALGHNAASWALDISDGRFSFWSNKERLELSGRPASRLGVFLDHSAGVVSFYSISHSMRLLHRLYTSFSQPLHVGVWIRWSYHGDTVYFPKLQSNPFVRLICS